MATGRVSRVTVFGRVAYPAQVIPASKDTFFLNFSLLVDGLAREKNDRKQRKSGKISCSYMLKGDPSQDPVAVLLTNIYNSKTGQGALGGHTYKSVEAVVEGVMVLTETEASSYYVGMEYCNVTITDNGLLGLYKQLTGQNRQQQPQQAPQPQLATTAPNMAPQQPVVQQPQPQVQPQAPQQPMQQPVPQAAQMQTVPAQQPLPAANAVVSAEERAAVEASRTLAQNSQVLNAAPQQAAVQQPSTSVKQLLEGEGTTTAQPAFTGQVNPV